MKEKGCNPALPRTHYLALDKSFPRINSRIFIQKSQGCEQVRGNKGLFRNCVFTRDFILIIYSSGEGVGDESQKPPKLPLGTATVPSGL